MSAEMIEAPMPTCSARNSGDARFSSVILPSFWRQRFSRCRQRVSLHCLLAEACLRMLIYLLIYNSGKVSLEQLLLSWYPSQSIR